jgi:hypothetical protein
MPTKPKQSEQESFKPKASEEDSPSAGPDKLESLRTEIIEILEEYLSELHDAADKNPGEQNIPPLRAAQDALNLFRPQNVYPS